MKARYIVRKANQKDVCYGAYHASHDCDKTVCGKIIDKNWWILNNDFDGIITCKKCEDKKK